MSVNERAELQRRIITSLQVSERFNAAEEAELRIDFIKDQIMNNKRKSVVLGISGGVDSTVCGRLCQLAAERARSVGYEARFYAVRLPYGEQHDEQDAQRAMRFIGADKTVTVDIRPAAEGMLNALEKDAASFDNPAQRDFVFGNIKARQRMIAQYALAGAHEGLVVGTDHAAEAVMGFFTKFGDGAFDIGPLYGLNKRRVREIGRWLRAPDELVQKIPTADLEELVPGKPDEDALGVTYQEIDDFLEGKKVSDEAFETIIEAYRRTNHKRALPAVPQQKGLQEGQI